MKTIDQRKMLNSIRRSGCSEFAAIALHIQFSKGDAGRCYAAVKYVFYYCRAYSLATKVVNKV